MRRPAIIALVLLACREPHGHEQATAPQAIAADAQTSPCRVDGDEPIVLDGCAGVLGDDRCVLGPETDRLRLWRPSAAAGCAIAIDGELIAAKEQQVDGGWRAELPIGSGAHELALVSPNAAAVWTRSLVEDPPPVAGSERARLLDAIARRRAAFAREDWTAMVAAAGEAFELAQQLERWSDACAAAFAAAHVLGEMRGELVQARDWLARTQTCLAHDRAQLTRLHTHRGRIAALAGDERTAQTEYRAAARTARRIGRVDDELAASAAHAELARSLGDGVALAELVARITELSAAGVAGSCLGAIAMSDVAWAQLMLAEHRRGAVDPRPALQQALAILETPDCLRASVVAHTRLNLALAELQAGDVERAAAVLARVDRDGLDAGARPWFHDLRIRVALAQGDPRAAADDLDALERAAGLQRDGELRWRAALRRGELALALGERARALAALRGAEAELDRLGLELALELGRPQYLAQRGRSAELLVATLVEEGELELALCAARRARARAIRGLELAARVDVHDPRVARARVDVAAARDQLDRMELDSRRLPGSELAAARERLAQARARLRARIVTDAEAAMPAAFECERDAAAGVLTLTYAPQGEGWIGFAHDDAGIAAARIAAFDPHGPHAAIGEAVLAPFRARIEAAQRVHVVAEGALLEVPVHALPWRDGVLVDHTVVAWSVDLPALPRAPAGGEALVVFADAQHDLGHLRALADRASARVQASGWRLHADGGEADRGAVLRRALGQVELFHYLGHVGVPSFERGEPHPWSTMLLLDEGTLGIEDVLALPKVPESVVLLGCGTALAGPLRPGSGEGLAQAFLAAGSRQVIAAVGDVDAELAATMGAALYEDDTFDAAAALARVQREARRTAAPEGWWVLRAWVR